MTQYLLDTNIISDIIKPEPSQALLEWLGARKDNDLYIASLTVAEIQRGILEKPPGRKRTALDAWFAGPEGPQMLFAGRILSFDERAGASLGKVNGGRHNRRPSPKWIRHDHCLSRERQ